MKTNLRMPAMLALLSITCISCNNYFIGHTFFGMPKTSISAITFETMLTNENIRFVYPDTAGNTYLRQLRLDNNLSGLIANANNDRGKALIILNWTHNQWKHDGSNKPSKSDALTILKEAKEGKKFRCVEYGIVSCDALLSLGIKARRLQLKTKDVELCKRSAGHVLAEVWLADISKWALIDGQFNVMPVLNDTPLNAVELQQAIIEKRDFNLIDINGVVSNKQRNEYLVFIPHYLYYFDVMFDNRHVSASERHMVEGKSSLMLVPKGSKNPTIFQRKYPLDYCLYTNSVADFYQKP